MSITDELRDWAHGFTEPYKRNEQQLLAIADRIDAKHESACGEAYGNGVQSVALPDMTAYIKLPKDADGVPIRVGDVIKLPNGRSEEVRYMIINGAGWLINEAGWISCKVSHDKPDTWERIIEDAMGRYSDADADALVARCKALAGEDE